MTVEPLRDLLTAIPFRPFTIHLTDRRSCRIPHPEFLELRPEEAAVVAHRVDGTTVVIELGSIKTLEVHGLAREGRPRNS